MIRQIVLTFLPFAVSTTATPGPNNLMVTASGTNFGFKRTIPHILGIAAGLPVMVLLLGGGLGRVFVTYPHLHDLLRWVGAVYLLYLAYHIATADPVIELEQTRRRERVRPLTFWQAAAFQWVNPKAWLMALSDITLFTTPGGDIGLQLAALALTAGLVILPAVGSWALFGVAVGRLLRSRQALRRFNLAMATLLVLSLIPLFRHG